MQDWHNAVHACCPRPMHLQVDDNNNNGDDDSGGGGDNDDGEFGLASP